MSKIQEARELADEYFNKLVNVPVTEIVEKYEQAFKEYQEKVIEVIDDRIKNGFGKYGPETKYETGKYECLKELKQQIKSIDEGE